MDPMTAQTICHLPLTLVLPAELLN